MGYLRYDEHKYSDPFIRSAEIIVDTGYKDINDPDAEVRLVGYLWIADKKRTRPGGYVSGKSATVEIDLKDRTVINIRSKTDDFGKPVIAENIEEFINDVNDILDG